jgi:xanthine dehydrogenase accessory factor
MNDVLASLAELSETGKTGVLCTIVKTKGSTPRKEGSKMLVYPDGTITGTIGGGEVESRVIKEAIDALSSGESRVIGFDLVDPEQGDPGICGGRLEVFIDPLGTPDQIVVVGGGHVGKAVVHLAKWMGYRTILTDDREDYCRPETVPDADQYIHCKFEELTSHYDINDGTSVVLATRSLQVDISGLPEILAKPVGYIGIISSKRRWNLTKEQLLDSGVKKDVLDMIHAPIGLNIQAETPEEIAISIMAEIIKEKRGGTRRLKR